MQPCAFVFRMTDGSVEEGGGGARRGRGKGGGGGGGGEVAQMWHGHPD